MNFNKSPFLECCTLSQVIDLLAERGAASAVDFLLAWGEGRNTSWMNAAREAATRCGSIDHLPQIRGQLRYHLGEVALANAAEKAGLGFIPIKSRPPGGVFNVARVGRFALASIVVRQKYAIHRRSVTRLMLGQANKDLEPQTNLFDGQNVARPTAELAYFGCVVAVPWRKDPTVPAALAVGALNADLTKWIEWIPLHRAYALLQERLNSAEPAPSRGFDIPDNVFPKLRLPKPGEGEDIA